MVCQELLERSKLQRQVLEVPTDTSVAQVTTSSTPKNDNNDISDMFASTMATLPPEWMSRIALKDGVVSLSVGDFVRLMVALVDTEESSEDDQSACAGGCHPVIQSPVVHDTSMLDEFKTTPMVAKVSPDDTLKIAWDSGAYTAVSSRQSFLSDRKPNGTSVMGLMGRAIIKQSGIMLPEFGLTHPGAIYIENSTVPNLMSVSQENNVDSKGRQGAVLFLHSVAYKFRVTKELEELILDLIQTAQASGVVTGIAERRNGIYCQHIRGPRQTADPFLVSAISSMYNMVTWKPLGCSPLPATLRTRSCIWQGVASMGGLEN